MCLGIFSTYEVATACALAVEAEKLICIIDGPILDQYGRLIRFLTLQDADLLIRKRAEQSEIAANYVKAVGQEDLASLVHADTYPNNDVSPGRSGNGLRELFQNGVGFDNGNGLWIGEQGFAIGGQERLSRLNGYLSELAAAAFVCRVGPFQMMASSLVLAFGFVFSFFLFYHLHYHQALYPKLIAVRYISPTFNSVQSQAILSVK